jgi:hypothetical protein
VQTIIIRPSRYRQFGAAEGSVFCLVTNTSISEKLVIEDDAAYREHVRISFDPGDSFDDLLARRIPEHAHVLVISPHCFFRSPRPDQIGPRRKLMAMACNSTPTPLDAIAHFLEAMERTDPARQEAFADRFFELGEASDCLEIVDTRHGTRAVFEHLNDAYVWNQQAGPVEWGEQQIVPSGEISVLPIDIVRFDASLRLAVNGEIALHGQAVLHSGTTPYLREDQSRIYNRLARLRDHAAIATVEDGMVTRLDATHPDAEPAVSMLESMFDVDSRYRILWEIGFAINTALEMLPGNFAMNEVHGGTNGALHWGFGLTPFTQYHLDITCFNTQVFGANNELLIGTPR